MNELIDLRRQLLSGHLTQDQVRDVKRHITVRLDWGNEHLGLDLVPRKEFEMVDAEQISVSDLYKMLPAILAMNWASLHCQFEGRSLFSHLSSRHSVQQSTSQVVGRSCDPLGHPPFNIPRKDVSFQASSLSLVLGPHLYS
ncbi:DOCK3 protein, partial [Polypterus senegalus]|nr:DOCK3 protein [Polypterus senegalus]